MDIFREIYEEAKKRVGSPIVGTVSFTILLWNFDPIFRLIYLSTQGLIVSNVDLEIFHNEFSLWHPIVIGLFLVPFRRGLELLGAFSFVFLESLYNRWLHRAELPDLHKQITNLKLQGVKSKNDLEKMKTIANEVFSLLVKENLRNFTKNLSKINDYAVVNVHELTSAGEILTYNISTKEFQVIGRRDPFNGILAFKFSPKLGIVVFTGRVPTTILRFAKPDEIIVGAYEYSRVDKILTHASYNSSVVGKITGNVEEFEILNCEKPRSIFNPMQNAGF